MKMPTSPADDSLESQYLYSGARRPLQIAVSENQTAGYNRRRNHFQAFFECSVFGIGSRMRCALNGFAVRRCLSRQSRMDSTAFETDTLEQATQCYREMCCRLHVHHEDARLRSNLL
jgi:hypothetical protein